jgi:hypothetical protein
LLAGSSLTPGEQEGILTWYEAVLSQKTTPEQITHLAALPMPAAPDLPGTMAADLKRIAQDYEGALADYEAIGAQPQALEARRRAVDLAVTREWDAVTTRLLSQKAYDEAVHAFPDDLADHVARGQLDVGRLLHNIMQHSLKGLQQFDYLFLSLLVGVVWFISLHKASRIPRRLWWISLAAIPLGMFSTVITLVLGELQEARHGLSETGQVGPDFVFWIASVGLREEVSKMICVLPLLLLLRKGTPAQALMAASCVGLGFAVEENINYLAGSHGTDLLGRFVTANFRSDGNSRGRMDSLPGRPLKRGSGPRPTGVPQQVQTGWTSGRYNGPGAGKKIPLHSVFPSRPHSVGDIRSCKNPHTIPRCRLPCPTAGGTGPF